VSQASSNKPKKGRMYR